MKKQDLKTSVRISLNQDMRDAFQFLRKRRYPFMKEDEIFKLAFSRLYASEYDSHEAEVAPYRILLAIREQKPGFGVEWMEEHQIDEKALSVEELAHIISREL